MFPFHAQLFQMKFSLNYFIIFSITVYFIAKSGPLTVTHLNLPLKQISPAVSFPNYRSHALLLVENLPVSPRQPPERRLKYELITIIL